MNTSKNKLDELHKKIAKGHEIAFKKMVDFKRKNGGSLVFFENGKIVKIKAVDFKG